MVSTRKYEDICAQPAFGPNPIVRRYEGIWAQPALGPNTLGLIMVLGAGVMLGLIMVLGDTSAGSGCICISSSSNARFNYGSECCLARFYAGYVYPCSISDSVFNYGSECCLTILCWFCLSLRPREIWLGNQLTDFGTIFLRTIFQLYCQVISKQTFDAQEPKKNV